jgi:hypothetical protein
MTWLRIILLFIDSGVLGFLIFMTIKEPPKGAFVWFVTGWYVLLILHITYIYFSKGSKDKEPWLITLYFRRKALEEKKKVQSLQNELDQKEL